MEYGCIGEKLGHSFSKEVHNRLFDYAEKAITDIVEIYGEIRKMIEDNLPADHPYKLFFANETEEITHIAEKIFDRNFDKARDKIPKKQRIQKNPGHPDDQHDHATDGRHDEIHDVQYQ